MKAQFPVCFTDLNDIVPKSLCTKPDTPAQLEVGFSAQGMAWSRKVYLHVGRAFISKLPRGSGPLWWVSRSKTQFPSAFPAFRASHHCGQELMGVIPNLKSSKPLNRPIDAGTLDFRGYNYQMQVSSICKPQRLRKQLSSPLSFFLIKL